MLNRASVTANIPAADLDRARSFYADTLGMRPSSEMADAMPGVTWDDGVADMGGMGKAAWFKDSEGNILCIDSGFPDS